MPQAPEETPLLVADLRASAVVHEELTWFFERALAEIELPSNFGAMVQGAMVGRIRRGGARQVETSDERRIEALHAARTIHGWLMRLRPMDRQVLVALYTSDDAGDASCAIDGKVARALGAYERTRRGGSVVPEQNEEED
jgi:hypothetical protein